MMVLQADALSPAQLRCRLGVVNDDRVGAILQSLGCHCRQLVVFRFSICQNLNTRKRKKGQSLADETRDNEQSVTT